MLDNEERLEECGTTYFPVGNTHKRLRQILESFDSEVVYFREENVQVHRGFPCPAFMAGFFKRLGRDSPIALW